MSNVNRPINCVFYSHSWVIHMLKHAGLGNLQQHVLVELAENSHIAPVFGEQGKSRYGLAGLLRLSGRLEQLAQPLKNVAAPVVLAPRPAVSSASLCSAVGLLASTPSKFQQATLLVQLQDAEQFLDAYQYVDTFTLLWDIADPPNASLLQTAKLFVEHQILDAERWHGWHFYRHPNRPVENAAETMQELQTMLQEFPALNTHAN